MIAPRQAWLVALLLCALLIPTATAAADTRPTAGIIFHFEGETPNPMQPPPRDVAEAVLFGTGPIMSGPFPYPWDVREYFQTITYGIVDYAGTTDDIYGPYEIGPYEGSCQLAKWTDEAADEAEAKDGFDRNSYRQLAYYLEPSTTATACGAYGVGSVGFSFSKGINDTVTLHEFGHGLTATPGHPGSPHASTLRCFDGPTAVAYSASCNMEEGLDPFDPMGGGRRGAIPLEMSAWRKLNFGAIPAADAPTIAYAGTYTIAPLEQANGLRLLRIPSGDGKFIDLEFRRPIGTFDGVLSAAEPVTNGVSLHLDPATFAEPGDSLLIDTTPTTESFEDASLMPGQRFTNFRTGVTVETVSAGSGGATVKVTGLPDPPVGPISKLTKRGCKVPNLKQRKLKAARKSISKRKCKVGKVKLRPSRKVPKGKVISQKPKAGKRLAGGAKVTVVVSSGPKPKQG